MTRKEILEKTIDFDDAINRIVRLEEENAELKEKLNFSTQYYQGEKAKEQLNKAKQIIQEFLELNYSEFTKTNAVFLHADKFLKES